MTVRNTVRAELEEQRCLLERQQIELKRQRARMEVQLRQLADLQTQLDSLVSTLRRATLTGSPALATSRDGNGDSHAVPMPPQRTTRSGRDHT